ncbi:hypothetical protein Patl1_31936 [Pistacia atlantica]|uniref:Uncharacterized protein n=1 Tax=Pistacia atlantica TaxID=434234 RepID=A0ACC1AQG2_9ROSI|nr:hypothetical protein Patl1_31936 [Pistacia atlantica]
MKNKLYNLFNRSRPFIGVVFLQVGLAGMDVLCKAALNQGMSNYVLVVYRHAVATLVIVPFAAFLDKKIRPRLTLPIFTKLLLLGLLEPVIDQNLYYIGMKHTTATFAAAMYNILPAITFLMAWAVRLEKVKIKSIHSQAKIIGTIATVAGSDGHDLDESFHSRRGYASWAQLEGSIVALVMERGKSSIWAIHWDTKLMAAVYSGIVCSGLAYYIQGIIMKDRGPVFVSAFSPLCMVIVAIMSSIILAEQMYLGRVIGAIIVVAGLYLVVWGKSKDYASPSTSIDEKISPAAEKIGCRQQHRRKF